MSSWSKKQRPITVAILALGGEGGGVLNDWIVATAESAGYYAQNTSVAGVAQRTGATVYYAELFPPAQQLGDDGPDAAASVRNEPVMSIFPAPGEVDVVITSELMECGRAIQRGFSTPDRTTLITSTSRSYAIDEKMALGDGRVDDGELLAAARKSSAHLVATDFAQLADRRQLSDQRVAVRRACRLRSAAVQPRAVRGFGARLRQGHGAVAGRVRGRIRGRRGCD